MPIPIPEDYEKIDPTKTAFTPVPKGRYLATIARAGERDGQVEMTLEIEDEEFKGRKVWDYLRFDSKNNWGILRTKAVLDKLGIAIKGGELFDPAVLAGRQVFVSIVVDTYNPDKPKNKVEYNGYELVGAAVTEDEPF